MDTDSEPANMSKPISFDPTTATSSDKSKKRKLERIGQFMVKKPLPFLLLPYVVGILWHGLHPMFSVLTGDFKNPRRWYIDENSLDPSHFPVNVPYDLVLQTKYDRKVYSAEEPILISSFCQGIKLYQQQHNEIGLPCRQHKWNENSFEIVKIAPISGAVAPASETIIILIPPFQPFLSAMRVASDPSSKSAVKKATEGPLFDKSRPQFQSSILQLIRRLSSPKISPWLAKTILFVSPIANHTYTPTLSTATSMNPLLEETLDCFLNSYIGKIPSRLSLEGASSKEMLPFDFTDGVIRQLIVVDLDILPSVDSVSPRITDLDNLEIEVSEVRLLPQGRQGLLPNMDMTFLIRYVYDRAQMMSSQQLSNRAKHQRQLVQLTMHPHQKLLQEAWRKLKDLAPPEPLLKWSKKMLDLLSFELVMAVGPYPPHAPALKRGIDSLTIQGVFVSATDNDDYDTSRGNIPKSKLSPQQYPQEMVHKIELVIRGLSNLHERLHHSTSLYVLPSKDRFVKHEEYLVPNLLLVIPFIMRAMLLVFRQHLRFKPDFSATKAAAGACLCCTLICALDVDSKIASERNMYMAILFPLLIISTRDSTDNAIHSVHFTACLLALCMHISLAFGHVSLSYPSALLWTPLIALPTFKKRREGNALFRFFCLGLRLALIIATSPFAMLVPRVFPLHSAYVDYGYIPLHTFFSILHLMAA